jgi:peptidyl-tRNA hydrolase
VGPSEERWGLYSDLADFVLAPFARDERDDVLALLPPLTATVETWLHEGAEKAMNLHNRAPESNSDS